MGNRCPFRFVPELRCNLHQVGGSATRIPELGLDPHQKLSMRQRLFDGDEFFADLDGCRLLVSADAVGREPGAVGNDGLDRAVVEGRPDVGSERAGTVSTSLNFCTPMRIWLLMKPCRTILTPGLVTA